MFKAKKLVLAGDPKQLPPTILSVDKRDKKRSSQAKQGPSAPLKGKKEQKVAVKKPEPEPVVESTEAVDEHDSSSSSSDEEGDSAEDSAKPPEKPTKPAGKVKSKAKKPAIRSLRPPRSLETTLFDRMEKLYGPDIKRMLNVQYRCVSKP